MEIRKRKEEREGSPSQKEKEMKAKRRKKDSKTRERKRKPLFRFLNFQPFFLLFLPAHRQNYPLLEKKAFVLLIVEKKIPTQILSWLPLWEAERNPPPSPTVPRGPPKENIELVPVLSWKIYRPQRFYLRAFWNCFPQPLPERPPCPFERKDEREGKGTKKNTKQNRNKKLSLLAKQTKPAGSTLRPLTEDFFFVLVLPLFKNSFVWPVFLFNALYLFLFAFFFFFHCPACFVVGLPAIWFFWREDAFLLETPPSFHHQFVIPPFLFLPFIARTFWFYFSTLSTAEALFFSSSVRFGTNRKDGPAEERKPHCQYFVALGGRLFRPSPLSKP